MNTRHLITAAAVIAATTAALILPAAAGGREGCQSSDSDYCQTTTTEAETTTTVAETTTTTTTSEATTTTWRDITCADITARDTFMFSELECETTGEIIDSVTIERPAPTTQVHTSTVAPPASIVFTG